MFNYLKALQEIKQVEKEIKGLTLNQAFDKLKGADLDEDQFNARLKLSNITIMETSNGLVIHPQLEIFEDEEVAGALYISYEYLKKFARIPKQYRRYCKRCHGQVIKSDCGTKENGYKYQCLACDEDLFTIETYQKGGN